MEIFSEFMHADAKALLLVIKPVVKSSKTTVQIRLQIGVFCMRHGFREFLFAGIPGR